MSYAKSKKVAASAEQRAAEAKRQRFAFYAQKREMLFTNALVALLQHPTTSQVEVEANVRLALDYADKSFAALYISQNSEEDNANGEDEK